MSRLFGEVRQLGFVVRDIDAALAYWTGTLGVGPFFVVRGVRTNEYVFRGEPSPGPTLHIALGNSGDLQIELIEQVSDHATVYKEFLESGREGMQHVSSWVTPAEFKRRRAALIDDGMVVAQEGLVRGNGVRFAYFDTANVPGGLQYEISDVLDAAVHSIFDGLATMAKNWDGKDPIRELSS